MAAKHLLHMTIDQWGGISFTLTHEGDFAMCGTWTDDLGHGEVLPSCFLIDWLSELGGEMLQGEWPADPHFPLPVKWEGDGDAPHLVHDAFPTVGPNGHLVTDAEADRLIVALADADLYGQLVAPELDDD